MLEAANTPEPPYYVVMFTSYSNYFTGARGIEYPAGGGINEGGAYATTDLSHHLGCR